MICLLYETHSSKLADPGKIVQTGLSAGSRFSPSDYQMMPLQNLIRRLPMFSLFFGCLFAKDFLVLSQII